MHLAILIIVSVSMKLQPAEWFPGYLFDENMHPCHSLELSVRSTKIFDVVEPDVIKMYQPLS